MSHSSPTDPLERAQRRINDLRAELTTKLKVIDELKAAKETHEGTIHRLEKKVNDLQQEMTVRDRVSKESENAFRQRMSEETKSLEDERKRIDQQKEEMSMERKKCNEEGEGLRRTIDSLQSSLHSKDAEIRRLQQSSSSELVAHQLEFSAVKDEKVSFIRKYEEDRFRLSNRLESTEGQLSETKAKLVLSDRKVFEVTEGKDNEIRALNEEIRRIQRERERDQREFGAFKEEFERIKSQMEDQKDKQLGAAHEKYMKILADSAAEIEEIRKKAMVTQQQIEAVREWEKQREQLESALVDAKSELRILHKDVDEKIKVYEDASKDTQSELQKLKDAIDSLTKEKKSLSDDLQKKSAALKVFHNLEVERTTKHRQEAKPSANNNNVNSNKKETTRKSGGFLDRFFGSEKGPSVTPADSSAVSSPPSDYPSRGGIIRSSPSDDVDELEEEVAVALTSRVERLTEEKMHLEGEIKKVESKLQTERMLTASLRAQLAILNGESAKEGKAKIRKSSDSSGTTTSGSASTTSLPTDPLELHSLLSNTISELQQSDALRQKQEIEMKRLKDLIDVRTQEVAEAKLMLKMQQDREKEKERKEKDEKKVT